MNCSKSIPRELRLLRVLKMYSLGMWGIVLEEIHRTFSNFVLKVVM